MLKNSLAAGICGAILSISAAQAGDGAMSFTVTSGLPENHMALRLFQEHFRAELDRRLTEAGGEAPRWVETHDGTLSRFGGTLEAVEDDLSLFGIVSVNHEGKTPSASESDLPDAVHDGELRTRRRGVSRRSHKRRRHGCPPACRAAALSRADCQRRLQFHRSPKNQQRRRSARGADGRCGPDRGLACRGGRCTGPDFARTCWRRGSRQRSWWGRFCPIRKCAGWA